MVFIIAPVLVPRNVCQRRSYRLGGLMIVAAFAIIGAGEAHHRNKCIARCETAVVK